MGLGDELLYTHATFHLKINRAQIIAVPHWVIGPQGHPARHPQSQEHHGQKHHRQDPATLRQGAVVARCLGIGEFHRRHVFLGVYTLAKKQSDYAVTQKKSNPHTI